MLSSGYGLELVESNYRSFSAIYITSGNNIGNIQFNYFACRDFIFHNIPPYINKASMIDCKIIISYFWLFVNTFL